jgi:hypothetical protein
MTERPARDRRADVIRVLESLVAEWGDGKPETWENWTIPDYLEAMSAWLGSADASYAFRGEPVPSDGWQFFIDALSAAARYD